MRSAKAKVLFRKDKVLKGGKYPLYLRIIKDRKANYHPLGHEFYPSELDKNLKRLKQNHPLATEIAIKIKNWETEAERVILDIERENKDYTAETIIKRIKQNGISKKTVYEYFDLVIERLKSEERIGYSQVFKETKRELMNFRNKKDFSFYDIDTTFLNKFEKYFVNKNCKKTSIFVFMRTLKTLVNYAKKDGTINKDFQGFSDYDFKKFRGLKTTKRAISKDYIDKIKVLDLEGSPSLIFARDIFLFSYYCRGMNFIDIANLKYNNLEDFGLQLGYTRKKTKRDLQFKILGNAMEIIRKYNLEGEKKSDDYVFPILSRKYDTESMRYNRVKKMRKQVNEGLNIIGQKLGISIKLTTYVARHSFATVLYNNNTPLGIIKETLGHSSVNTTEIYLKDIAKDVVDKAVEEAML